MERRIILCLDIPEGIALPDALEAVSEDIPYDGDDVGSGYARTGGGSVGWRCRTPGAGVELDPRQREAAALLLMAFDLPQNMLECATTMLEAADVNPGMRTDAMGASNRTHRLERARDIIEALLAEARP